MCAHMSLAGMYHHQGCPAYFYQVQPNFFFIS